GRKRRASCDVVGPEAVEFLRVFQGSLKAFALLREHVDDYRMIAGFGELKRADQQRQIVYIDRTEVTHAHFFEDQAAAVTAAPVAFDRAWARAETGLGERALKTLLGLVRKHEGQLAFGQTTDEPLEILCELIVRGVCDEFVEVIGNRSDV